MTEGAGKDESNSITEGPEVSKGLATAVVVLYVVGFLVVTFHLAQFGFVPMSRLLPQYLLAGVWCLLPTLMRVWIVSYGAGQAVVLLDRACALRPRGQWYTFAFCSSRRWDDRAR